MPVRMLRLLPQVLWLNRNPQPNIEQGIDVMLLIYEPPARWTKRASRLGRKYRSAIVVDEMPPRCGLATIVSLVTNKAYASLKAPPEMVIVSHTPVPFA